MHKRFMQKRAIRFAKEHAAHKTFYRRGLYHILYKRRYAYQTAAQVPICLPDWRRNFRGVWLQGCTVKLCWSR